MVTSWLTKDLTARGYLQSYEVTVTDQWYEIPGTWYSVDIFNDGSGDLYLQFNRDDMSKPWERNEAPIKADEHIQVNLGGRKYEKSPQLNLVCKSGVSTTVRLFRLA